MSVGEVDKRHFKDEAREMGDLGINFVANKQNEEVQRELVQAAKQLPFHSVIA